ncbi:P-loop containing nucleoside triphosphate hydrolase protein [Lyophyllum atratum]|nr:P-loop containing nucleoside triphosphate hydrolase protein [Lyophyllum atratum]
MATHTVPTLAEHLNIIRSLPDHEIRALVASQIPQAKFPSAYVEQLEDNDRSTAYRVCLLTWTVTGHEQVPRELQLRAFLAMHHGRDSLVDAGTGSGKTLVIVLSLLLDNPQDHHLSITISPLKRLQISQANDFNTQYLIPTLAINDDTPRDNSFWNEYVHNLQTRTPGKVQHIIATVEQLFKTPQGHMPRLGGLVRNRFFQRRIKRIHVDEAHFIYLAGLDRNGSKAFRPAWGRLDELKTLLPHSITWQAMSATFPPHILKTVETKVLRPNYITIRTSSNRPNTTYATHRVVTSIEELKNYDCFLVWPFVLENQPRVLIFFDNKKLTDNAAEHLDKRLPLELQGKGIIRHYHSGMSNEYLQHVHSAFTEEKGICKILCATSGESVGVDFPDVKIVCTAGLPNDLVEALQRGGRVGRRSGDVGLFVIFYESWALNVSVEEYAQGDLMDPDRPRGPLKPTSNARERAAYSSVQLVQCQECIRVFFAAYLNDTSSNALDFLTEFCCDRHQDSVFDLSDFLPGPIYTGDPPVGPIKRKKPPVYRNKKDRYALDACLITWLKITTQDGRRAAYDILASLQRRTLVRAQPKSINCPAAITKLLGETDEWARDWAEPLFKIVTEYDKGLEAIVIHEKRLTRALKKAKTG